MVLTLRPVCMFVVLRVRLLDFLRGEGYVRFEIAGYDERGLGQGIKPQSKADCNYTRGVECGLGKSLRPSSVASPVEYVREAM